MCVSGQIAIEGEIKGEERDERVQNLVVSIEEAVGERRRERLAKCHRAI